MDLTKNITPNDNFHLKDLGYSNADTTVELPRHRWYFVKEAFSPHIVDKAIEDAGCKTSDLILDPFSGSGTVALSGTQKGYRVLGIEVNPFLAFVARAKLTQCAPKTLDKGLDRIMSAAKRGTKSPLEDFSTFLAKTDGKKGLFNQAVLRAFEGGWQATGSLYQPVRDLLRLSLLGAAMDTCNAARDGKCLRYYRNWRELDFGSDGFLDSLNERVQLMRQDLLNEPVRRNESIVRVGDSRKILSEQGIQKFKLCVTSPPYLNSFDYTDVYRPELFLGKFIRTQQQLRMLRQKTLRSHVQANWRRPIESAFGERYKESLELINARADMLWDKRIPLMIQAYFEDMKQVLRDLRRIADDNAKVWIVVSTSAYSGVEIPVDLILAQIGTEVGWFLQEVGVIRYLRSSGQHWNNWSGPEGAVPRLRESAVILSAAPL